VCERCGRNTHTVDQCFALSDIHGVLLRDEQRGSTSVKPSNEDLSKCSCERCGRNTHDTNDCKAILDLNGSLLVSDTLRSVKVNSGDPRRRPTCERCGRNTHAAKQCHSVFDINGILIDDPSSRTAVTSLENSYEPMTTTFPIETDDDASRYIPVQLCYKLLTTGKCFCQLGCGFNSLKSLTTSSESRTS
jgi:hypothetical protein